SSYIFFFFQAEDGIRDSSVTGVQTCALPISLGFVPAQSEAVLVQRPGHLQEAARRGESAIFGGVGGELVEDQRQADRELGGKEQRIAIELEADIDRKSTRLNSSPT